ncbi:MAG: hypothetical protein ACOYU5_01745 [Stygiobacter sp.]
MKKLLFIFALISFVIYTTNFAQTTQPTKPNQPTQPTNPNQPNHHGKNFVDKNGDGYNDNAPDHDGDGIPNGIDPDFKGHKFHMNKFIDLNGDGINDNVGKGMTKNGKGGNGMGNRNMMNSSNGDPTQNQTGMQGSGHGMMNGRKK